MKNIFTFEIEVDVYDREQLYDAARAQVIKGGIEPEQVDDYLKPQGEVDVPNCLVMLLDPGTVPGCSVQESTAYPASL